MPSWSNLAVGHANHRPEGELESRVRFLKKTRAQTWDSLAQTLTNLLWSIQRKESSLAAKTWEGQSLRNKCSRSAMTPLYSTKALWMPTWTSLVKWKTARSPKTRQPYSSLTKSRLHPSESRQAMVTRNWLSQAMALVSSSKKKRFANSCSKSKSKS